jgi:hypothetical protein
MVSIQRWVEADPRYVDSGIQLESSIGQILSPINIHKTIMKNIASLDGIVLVSQLAKEMNVTAEELLPSFEVLRDLKLIEMDEHNEVLRLTDNGKFANLDYLC